jgi:ketosteroid isomerase-like protein
VTTQRATDEADIRRRIDLVEAIRAMDLERVMSIYSADMVSFDIVPPLQHLGVEAKRKIWLDAFAGYQHPLGYRACERRDGNALGVAQFAGKHPSAKPEDLVLRKAMQ